MTLKVQYFTMCVIVSGIYACYYNISRLLAGNQLMVEWRGGGGGMRKGHVDTFSVILVF